MGERNRRPLNSPAMMRTTCEKRVVAQDHRFSNHRIKDRTTLITIDVVSGIYARKLSRSITMSPGSRPRPSLVSQGQSSPAPIRTTPRMMSQRAIDQPRAYEWARRTDRSSCRLRQRRMRPYWRLRGRVARPSAWPGPPASGPENRRVIAYRVVRQRPSGLVGARLGFARGRSPRSFRRVRSMAAETTPAKAPRTSWIMRKFGYWLGVGLLVAGAAAAIAEFLATLQERRPRSASAPSGFAFTPTAWSASRR